MGLPDKLQKFQNRAARVITGADYDVRSSEVLNKLGWETLAKRRELNKLVLMYKVLGNHTAPNLKDLFSRRNASQNIYDLRNSETDLSLKKPKTEFLKKTFGYSEQFYGIVSRKISRRLSQLRHLKQWRNCI